MMGQSALTIGHETCPVTTGRLPAEFWQRRVVHAEGEAHNVPLLIVVEADRLLTSDIGLLA